MCKWFAGFRAGCRAQPPDGSVALPVPAPPHLLAAQRAAELLQTPGGTAARRHHLLRPASPLPGELSITAANMPSFFLTALYAKQKEC